MERKVCASCQFFSPNAGGTSQLKEQKLHHCENPETRVYTPQDWLAFQPPSPEFACSLYEEQTAARREARPIWEILKKKGYPQIALRTLEAVMAEAQQQSQT